MSVLVFLPLLVLACDTPPAAPQSPPAPETISPTSAPDSTPAPASPPVVGGSGGSSEGAALPDVSKDMRGGQCGNGPGAEGADSYFLGQFSISGGGQVSGEERWQLYANDKWKARGGKDCSITWRVSGQQVSETGACGRCDLAVRFHATADLNGSDCPEELVRGRLLPNGQRVGGEAQDFDNTYAIERRSDGTARIYFAKSGKLLGEGYHNAGGFNYVSDHACKWF